MKTSTALPTLLILLALSCTAAPTAATPIPTQTPPPTAVANSTPASLPDQATFPQALVFAPGETSATIEANIAALGRHEYRLFASAGQTITIHISSPNNDVTYSISGLDPFQSLMQNSVSYSLSYPIPASQEYAIAIIAQGPQTTYMLTVDIPPLPSDQACVISTPVEFDIVPPSLVVYSLSSSSSLEYATANYGSSFEVLLTTSDGWYGVDTGVSTDQGYSRLRWIKPSSDEAVFRGFCDIPQVLSFNTLANATYTFPLMPSFTLIDGEADHQEGEGSISRFFYLTNAIEYGDVDTDGSLDALVVIRRHTGGTGQFVELALVLNDGGQPHHIATFSLGDRTIVNDILVTDDGIIELHLTETFSHNWTSSCCGPQDVIVQLRFENGELIEHKVIPPS